MAETVSREAVFLTYNAFIALWEENGSPSFNGGHANKAYKAFLAKWEASEE